MEESEDQVGYEKKKLIKFDRTRLYQPDGRSSDWEANAKKEKRCWNVTKTKAEKQKAKKKEEKKQPHHPD